VLLLGVRGTPFLYAGEELGLEDAVVPPERVVDPGGRDGCRAPLPWTAAAPHGWGENPWLPFPPDAEARSVEAQRDDPSSVLWLYKRLLAARKASPALRRGDLQLLDAEVVAFTRQDGDDLRAVVVDVTGGGGAVPQELTGWTVEVASDGPDGEGGPLGDTLAPGRAAVLRPF
jgi:alpha-glucosidase